MSLFEDSDLFDAEASQFIDLSDVSTTSSLSLSSGPGSVSDITSGSDLSNDSDTISVSSDEPVEQPIPMTLTPPRRRPRDSSEGDDGDDASGGKRLKLEELIEDGPQPTTSGAAMNHTLDEMEVDSSVIFVCPTQQFIFELLELIWEIFINHAAALVKLSNAGEELGTQIRAR